MLGAVCHPRPTPSGRETKMEVHLGQESRRRGEQFQQGHPYPAGCDLHRHRRHGRRRDLRPLRRSGDHRRLGGLDIVPPRGGHRPPAGVFVREAGRPLSVQGRDDRLACARLRQRAVHRRRSHAGLLLGDHRHCHGGRVVRQLRHEPLPGGGCRCHLGEHLRQPHRGGARHREHRRGRSGVESPDSDRVRCPCLSSWPSASAC